MASSNTQYNSSPLQWAGGKGKVLPTLLPILERYKRPTFVEPFVGAANVSLNFDTEFYVLADMNRDLINHHYAVIFHTEQYLKECEELFAQGFDAYTQVRDTFNSWQGDSVKHAAMFQYLNKHGFNGLCRYNKKGEFNVPIGTTTKPKNIPYSQIKAMAERFTKTGVLKRLWCVNFDTLFQCMQETSRKGDHLIYCDPPYVPLNSDFKYTAEGFGIEQQKRLAEWAKKSAHTTIISNHWTPLTEELYKDASDIIVFAVQRTISCKGDERKKVQECIAIYEK